MMMTELISDDYVWIGLRFEGPCDPSLREKHWLDGSEVNFQNWSEEQPNNLECNENSVLMDPTGEWSDYPDDTTTFFICQTEDISYCPQRVI
ncbi:hypothetical protein NECAME_14626 [Necator americanus]|uniref:C-type lectin domain-containing protein n=1 Tax=Necator americanus TaxID=51031 RepID=W2SLY8_NECAM|nr:hypothetical protein NECAME_14626 [Necator americanus]ETN70640.1 hypothetical protein NECAME_14626 [Necator americanus]